MNNLSLLIVIRWTAFSAFVTAFLLATLVLHLSLDPWPFCAVMMVIGASNICAKSIPAKNETLVASCIFLDIFLVTTLLYFYGGHANPFSTLYLAYVTLAGFFLSPALTWLSVLVTSLTFGVLFFIHRPIPEFHSHHGDVGGFNLHLQGMLVSFAITASLIATFSGKLKKMIAEREQELASGKEKGARLASLTTLAAGAAHELATPLSTIAVLAKDMESEVSEKLKPECREISEAVMRAKAVLEKMSMKAGEVSGEVPQACTTKDLQEEMRKLLDEKDEERVTFMSSRNSEIVVPRSGLTLVLLSLVRNALEASTPDQGVRVSSECDSKQVTFRISDSGLGIPEDILSRLGEPFLTTKEPGSGMGLGVFLARLFSERWHGTLDFQSKPGHGTEVILKLPLNCGDGFLEAA